LKRRSGRVGKDWRAGSEGSGDAFRPKKEKKMTPTFKNSPAFHQKEITISDNVSLVLLRERQKHLSIGATAEKGLAILPSLLFFFFLLCVRPHEKENQLPLCFVLVPFNLHSGWPQMRSQKALKGLERLGTCWNMLVLFGTGEFESQSSSGSAFIFQPITMALSHKVIRTDFFCNQYGSLFLCLLLLLVLFSPRG